MIYDEKYLKRKVPEELQKELYDALTFNINTVSDIPERIYNIAYKLAEKIKFSIAKNDKGQLVIDVYGADICGSSLRQINKHVESNESLKWLAGYTRQEEGKPLIFDTSSKCYYYLVPSSRGNDKQSYYCNYTFCPNRLAFYIAYRLALGQEQQLEQERKEYLQNKFENDINPKYKYINVSCFPIIYGNTIHLTKEKIIKTLEFINNNNVSLTNIDKKTFYSYDRSYYDKDAQAFGVYKNDFTVDYNHFQTLDCVSDTALRFSPCSGFLCKNRTFCEIKYASFVEALIQNNDLKTYLEMQEHWENELKERTHNLCSKYNSFSSVLESAIANNFFYGAVSGNSRKAVRDAVQTLADNIILKETLSPNVAKRTMVEMSKDLADIYNVSKYYGKEMYGSIPQNQVYILTGIDEFLEIKNSADFKQKANNLIKILSRIYGNTYIILAGEPDSLNKLYDEYPKLAKAFQPNTLSIPDFSVEEMYELFISEVKNKNIKLPNGFKKEFIQYIAMNKGRITFKNEELVSHLAQSYIDKGKLPEQYKTKNDSEAKLNLLIGLDSIKEKMKELKQYKISCKVLEEQGIKVPDASNHMLFYGNPGTGKTTVARIVAKMLYEIGILDNDNVVEAQRKDFIAEYTGQTAPKTQALINKAMGGVLFVDEAYSLVLNSWDTYGQEAIATLIKAMEDNRNNFVVIFAGYGKELSSFIESNSGIKSRISQTFYFPDYSVEELNKILETRIKKAGFKTKDNFYDATYNILNYFKGMKNFGNGRFVEKLLHRILIKHAKNNPNSKTLNITDIPSIEEIYKTEYGSDMSANKTETAEEAKIIAVHEIGHAVVAYALSEYSEISKITLVSDINAIGHVSFENNINKNFNELDHYTSVAISLSGKNAEKIIFGTHSEGCSGDIKKARDNAKIMVEKYAMGNYLENNADIAILKIAEKISMKVLLENKEEIIKLAEELLERKEIQKEEINSFFKNINKYKIENILKEIGEM